MSEVFVGGEFNVLEWLYINILRVEHSEDGCNRFFFFEITRCHIPEGRNHRIRKLSFLTYIV